MQHLLNLLAAIALLVWGTHIVRTGMLRVFGENLRTWLARSVDQRFTALLAGMGVTGLVQSSTATCLITSSFVAQGLITTAAALAIMLGADVGTSLITAVFSLDLSWLSPLLIFVGVVLFVSRQNTTAGRLGRVAIGLGLIILALQLILAATRPMTQSPAVQGLLAALPSEAMIDIFVGAVLAVLSYSSLAIVLLTATMSDSGLVPLHAAFGIVLGANLGSGVLAMLSLMKASPQARRIPLGNLLFKLIGVAIAAPLIPNVLPWIASFDQAHVHLVVAWHLTFNVALAVLFIGFTAPMARLTTRMLPTPKEDARNGRPRHLDPVALATPSLAITCAAREALHQADVVETMLRGILPVIRNDDRELADELRRMDDVVDELYSEIKYYLTKISRESLSEREGRRWADIISFTINMEQIGDIVERILQDVEDKKISRGRSFSDAGMAEISHLHERMMANLRLAMTVFLDGHVRDAQRLLQEKARFRDLERAYAASHLARLHDQTVQSMETSSLHLDLISELKRVNSQLCSIAYPILEAAGALADTRLVQPGLIDEPVTEPGARAG